MHKAWLLLIPLVVGGCQSTGSDSVSSAVPIGQERKIAYFYTAHEDCSSLGSTVVRITNQPAHGTLILREGRDYPTYPQSNPRSACNKHTVPVTLVYYRPAPGYAGADSFDLDAIFANGANRQRHYNIIVK